MKLWWLLLVFVTGILIPAQSAMNAKMQTFVLNPMYSSIINFGVGALVLFLLTCLTLVWRVPGHWRGAGQAPWWAWCGGLIGALFVTVAVMAVPQTGAATFLVAVIAGQICGALLLDHFGWLGLPLHIISWPRMTGAALVLAGVWLIQRY